MATHGRWKLTKPSNDSRDEPIYTLADAAHFLAIPSTTVRLWSLGQHYGQEDGRKFARPVLRIAMPSPPTLSFWNLVEVYVLASIRREHRVPMQKVRRALSFTSDKLGKKRPLIEQTFLTNGVDLFVERVASLVNVSQGGQMAMRDVLIGTLQRIDRDPGGLARRIYPWWKSPEDPRHIQIDPLRSSGRPVLTDTGVPTSEIADRFRAGDTIKHLAKDFGVKLDQIETALRWEAIAEEAA